MTSADVIQLGHNSRMSEAEYDRERAKLRALYGDNAKQAGAKLDQALAVLFHRSGWTQEQLAAKEVKQRSRKWVERHTRFGRFLNFGPTGPNSESALPANFTERKFRDYWDQTKGINERARFQQVIELLNTSTLTRPHRRRIGPDIVEKFGDGEWHPIAKVAAAIGAHESHVANTLHFMATYGTYGAKAERKKIPNSFAYRIFKQTNSINSKELRTKLAPLLKELRDEGNKSTVTMSPLNVRMIAARLEKLLDEWDAE